MYDRITVLPNNLLLLSEIISMPRSIKGPFYIYILFDRATAKPIYAGSTNNPKQRYGLHKHKLKSFNIDPVMALYKKVFTRESALKKEAAVVKYLTNKYGSSILNKYLKSKKYTPIVGMKKYQPKIKWKIISEDLKPYIYRRPFYGDYSLISRSCSYNPERIRQIFIQKPSKLHPDLFHVLDAYQKGRQKLGY